MQRERAGKPPWLRFVFSKAFPFHAGQQNPPRPARRSGCAAAAHE